MSADELDSLDPRRIFGGWERVFHVKLFGTPGPNVAAVVVDDGMAYVLYRKDFSPLGDIRERRDEVVKDRLAWPLAYVEAARRIDDEASRRFLYFARRRANNSELLVLGSFAGWIQSESDLAREMILWFEENGFDNLRDILGVTEDDP